jgi:hypothetical protein
MPRNAARVAERPPADRERRVFVIPAEHAPDRIWDGGRLASCFTVTCFVMSAASGDPGRAGWSPDSLPAGMSHGARHSDGRGSALAARV